MIPILCLFCSTLCFGDLSMLKHVVHNILTAIIYIVWICHHSFIHLFVASLSHYLHTVLP